MTTLRDVGVVIVAAGSSIRTRGASSELKQFRWVAGKPMLLHSVQTFQARPDVALVVCVLPRSAVGDPPPWLFQSDTERLLITPGGATRGESVRRGLEDLSAECRHVLIHDAARPLVTPDTIDRVVAEVRQGRGAVAALPVVDTLKVVAEDGRIERTIDRARLWRAQTPQGFPRDMILRAHEYAIAHRIDATDDAALCEAIGAEMVVVRGSERALKVTEEADFAIANAVRGLES